MLLYTFLRLNLLSILVLCSNNQINTFNTQTTASEIMLNDIENSLKAVTNGTNTFIRNKIIPQLYNLTSVSNFLFKIPNKQSELGYSMISMERSELMKPVFPNISLNQEEILLKNRHQEVLMQNFEGKGDKNVDNTGSLWSSFGLEGWSGEIANATELLETEHKEKTTSSKDNLPSSVEIAERSHGTHSDIVSDDSMEKAVLLNQEFHSKKPNGIYNSTAADISENVYIARANDPFGLSTKWAFRNETTSNKKDERSKRALVELYSMIKCATGCEPLSYQSYGCFCGFLGNGIAVDGIDSCCRMHDRCYEQSNCVSYLQYFIPYIWKCYHGKPLCALSHGEFGGPASCAALLCYCDMQLATCLRKFTCPNCKAVCRTSIGRKIQNIFF